MDLLHQIEQQFTDHVNSLFSSQTQFNISPEYQLNTDISKQQFGDITTNIALILSKQLKQTPRALAQKLVERFQHKDIAKIEVAGAGFINFFLKAEAWQNLLQDLALKGKGFFTLEPTAARYSYSIEFVSANPTGPLHIGHGRGGIIGDVLGNILRFIGHHVTKEFYINDAGSQIKKLGNSLKIRYLELLNFNVMIPEDGYQGEYLREIAQDLVTEYGNALIEKSDTFFEDYAKDILLAKIKHTLALYGINYDVWFSEKSLHDTNAVQKALDVLKANGYIYTQDNASWFETTKFGDDKDRVVRKSSGELTYVASDIAYIENKLGRGANRLLYILGQDHHSYVVRLKAIMQALGHSPEALDVILYQLVTVKETGAVLRLSKRAGRIVTLQDIIDTVGIDVARFFY
ncbi:MAG TPA: arginine--tRNA ligase, partial [Candidatus Babeliaceae bacterium]|nr:arginine--tRNA ligase [Candidatus Babeliaceae bacterium]